VNPNLSNVALRSWIPKWWTASDQLDRGLWSVDVHPGADRASVGRVCRDPLERTARRFRQAQSAGRAG